MTNRHPAVAGQVISIFPNTVVGFRAFKHFPEMVVFRSYNLTNFTV